MLGVQRNVNLYDVAVLEGVLMKINATKNINSFADKNDSTTSNINVTLNFLIINNTHT